MKKKNLKVSPREMEFLFEIGSIRHVQRTWKRFLNPDFEDLAAHHFRVVWLALLIAQHENVESTDKLMKMALVHDVAESRTGDADYLSRQYVERNEELGIKDILHNTALEEEFIKLWQEYENRGSLEAKIVKDADNLAVDFELKEQEVNGYIVGQGWKKNRKFVATDRLFTQTAKQIWELLQISDPNDWHYNGRNRYNDGDWKK